MKKDSAYAAYAAKRAPGSRLLPDCLRAFFAGGLICALAEACTALLLKLAIPEETARLTTTLLLILITAVLTGFGVFDNLAKLAGAGTLVPITGFANAVVSSSIDSRTEGLVTGVGVKLFTVAGPVILYGTAASVLYGLILWLTCLF